MELSVEEVEKAILEILGPGGQTELDVESGRVIHLEVENGHVTGFIAHPAFSRISLPERREILRRGLRQHFGEGLSEIGILLLFSPEEYREMAS